ncbi:phage tail assembly chaperone [Pseudomonas iridis]|uniref:Phage tail assembly chaperone n=1 Tax=Pseudomonas iridis TaxID=2710587 RepID=A0ABW8DIR2_9PSED
MRYYSPTTGSTYLKGVHAMIPDDAIPITEERYLSVIACRVDGKVRSHDAEGLPILIDLPLPTAEALEGIERAWRDAQLMQTDNLVIRHRDEHEDGSATTLSAEQYAELQAFRRALRNWPEGEEFPLVDHRPVVPSWLAGQTQ